jgi:hypothetical protein
MTRNFKAFLNLSPVLQRRYEGQYVIIVQGKLVAHGKDLVSILPKIRKKYPGETPFATKLFSQTELMVL